MKKKYYIDTCIWMDVLEPQTDPKHEYFAKTSTSLFNHILKTQSEIVVSDILIDELSQRFSDSQINDLFLIYFNLIDRVLTMREDRNRAVHLAQQLDMPKADVLHCLLAKKTNSILVTRDKHFKKLNDIWPSYKPEELIKKRSGHRK